MVQRACSDGHAICKDPGSSPTCDQWSFFSFNKVSKILTNQTPMSTSVVCALPIQLYAIRDTHNATATTIKVTVYITNCLFVLAFFLHVLLIAFKLDYQGTWHRCQHWGSIVEWRNFITGEKLHWQQVGLEPTGPCRQRDHCYKRAKPLHHLDRLHIFYIFQVSLKISFIS